MKRNLVGQGIALWILALVSTGCTPSRAAEAEKMYVLGSALTKLSASVEATVRYEDPPDGISDTELLALSTKHDPGLLELFADYNIHVSREDAHAVAIVCDKEEKVGLLEDAGCSSEMDRHLWKEDPPKPCKITLKAREACPEPEGEIESSPAPQGDAILLQGPTPSGQTNGDRHGP